MTKGTIHSGVERLLKAGKLKVLDSLELKETLATLKLIDWVVFIEGPLKPDSKPEHVLKYLAR